MSTQQTRRADYQTMLSVLAQNTMILIQCTNTKRDEPAPAKDIYDESRYFRKMRSWAVAMAESRNCGWGILSAKHGLLHPEREIKPYNERGLSDRQCETIATTLDRRGVGTVHITAGRDYTDGLIPELEKRGIDVINHFAGCRIGEREKRLEAKTLELRNR